MSKLKKILNKHSEDKTERVKTSLYLDKALYERFQEVCKSNGSSSSKVLEDVIRAFLEEVEK